MGRLRVPDGEPKNATVIVDSAVTDGALVTVRSLDAILAGAPRVDFLKIDTEGAEEDVTLGLSQTIARWRPRMILEFNPGRCRDPQGLLTRLRNSYPELQLLGFDAEVTPAGDAELLDPTNGEDRLLYLEANHVALDHAGQERPRPVTPSRDHCQISQVKQRSMLERTA